MTYTPQQATNIVYGVLEARGQAEGTTNATTLAALDYVSPENLLGLLAMINQKLPDSRKLGSGVTAGWTNVGNVVASVENA